MAGAHTWPRKGVIVSVISAAVASLALVLSATLKGPGPFESASRLVFSVPLVEFVRTAGDPGRDRRLDWRSDKCSAPLLGSAGKTYDFSDACRRHDFAYRNLGRLEGGTRWNAALRRRVDERFMRDMNDGCAARPKVQRSACRAWARLYYTAVRSFAGP